MYKTEIAAVVAAVLMTACAFDEGGFVPDSGHALYERLGTREALVLEPTSLVGVNARDTEGNDLRCVQPSVIDGSAMLRSTATGLLLVEALEIELTDVTIEPGVVYSKPVQLTDIGLRLGTQIVLEPEWRIDGTRAEGSGTADLLLDWALRAEDGHIYPLATQKLRDVDFLVDVRLHDDGTITADVTAAIEGRIGGFANRIHLSDFSLAVRATTPEPVIEID
jgi:hypothetical protein